MAAQKEVSLLVTHRDGSFDAIKRTWHNSVEVSGYCERKRRNGTRAE